MKPQKTNEGIRIKKDCKKSYVYIYDRDELTGTLMWHYAKKKWVFER